MNSGSLLASQPLGQQESSPHGKKVESDKDEDVLLASACVVMGVYTSRLYAHVIHHTYIHRIITHNSLSARAAGTVSGGFAVRAAGWQKEAGILSRQSWGTMAQGPWAKCTG